MRDVTTFQLAFDVTSHLRQLPYCCNITTNTLVFLGNSHKNYDRLKKIILAFSNLFKSGLNYFPKFEFCNFVLKRSITFDVLASYAFHSGFLFFLFFGPVNRSTCIFLEHANRYHNFINISIIYIRQHRWLKVSVDRFDRMRCTG